VCASVVIRDLLGKPIELHRNKDIDNMKKKTIDRDEKMRRSKRDKPTTDVTDLTD
jgi:hypothetical protein